MSFLSLLAVSPLTLNLFRNEARKLILTPARDTLIAAGLHADCQCFAIPFSSLEQREGPLAKHIAYDPLAETVIIIQDWFPTACLCALQKVAGKMMTIFVGEDSYSITIMDNAINYSGHPHGADYICVEGFGSIRIWYKTMEIDLVFPDGSLLRIKFSKPDQKQIFKMIDGLVRSIFGFDREEMKAIANGTTTVTKVPSPDPEQCWAEISGAYHSLASSLSKTPACVN